MYVLKWNLPGVKRRHSSGRMPHLLAKDGGVNPGEFSPAVAAPTKGAFLLALDLEFLGPDINLDLVWWSPGGDRRVSSGRRGRWGLRRYRGIAATPTLLSGLQYPAEARFDWRSRSCMDRSFLHSAGLRIHPLGACPWGRLARIHGGRNRHLLVRRATGCIQIKSVRRGP